MPGLPKPNRNRSVESAEDALPYATIEDDIDLEKACRGIVIGVPGTLKVRTFAEQDRILPIMPAGYLWPVQCVKIYAGEDSTAGDVVILP